MFRTIRTRLALFTIVMAASTPVLAAHRVLLQGNGKLAIVAADGKRRVGDAVGRHSRSARAAERPLHGAARAGEGRRDRSRDEAGRLVVRLGDAERQRRGSGRGPRVSSRCRTAG